MHYNDCDWQQSHGKNIECHSRLHNQNIMSNSNEVIAPFYFALLGVDPQSSISRHHSLGRILKKKTGICSEESIQDSEVSRNKAL